MDRMVGVLGIQLGTLYAIGREKKLTEEKQEKYLANAILTALRGLQLVAFTLLSRLWDYRLKDEFEILPEETELLQHFFHDEIGFSIREYVEFIHLVHGIYLRCRLTFPIGELKDFGVELGSDTPLRAACLQLHDIKDSLDQEGFTLVTCFEVERALTTVLREMVFFAGYKIASFKGVEYLFSRNDHQVSPLLYYPRNGAGQNSNAEEVYESDQAIMSSGVLLYRAQFRDAVDLSPFIIDYNALKMEQGAKVYFYSFRDDAQKVLNYSFLETISISPGSNAMTNYSTIPISIA